VAGVLATPAILLTPMTAQAAVVAPAADDADEAKRLYDEGLARFETHDYNGAVDKWTLAYGKLPEDATGQRNAMVYNIATAQEKAYDLDKDLQHLRQAALLLESYVANYKRIYKKTDETKAEVDKANVRIQGLRDRIAAAERGEVAAPPPTAPTPVGAPRTSVDGIQWNTGHAPPVDKEKLAHNRLLATQAQKGDQMVIAGYVVGSIGLLFLLSGAAAAGVGSNAESDGAVFSGVGLLVFGAAGVATGGALLGVGFKKKNAAKRGEIVLSPAAGRNFAGLGVAGRF
jgi:hypothetical protein